MTDYVRNISDNDFWKENNHNKLKKPIEYVQLHRSEQGKQPINLGQNQKIKRELYQL